MGPQRTLEIFLCILLHIPYIYVVHVIILYDDGLLLHCVDIPFLQLHLMHYLHYYLPKLLCTYLYI